MKEPRSRTHLLKMLGRTLALGLLLGQSTAQLVPQNICTAYDLALTKTASATSLKAGDLVTFTVKVTNQGDNPATNVVISDMLPKGFKFVTSSPAPSKVDTTSDPKIAQYYFKYAQIVPGETKTITIQASGVAPSQISAPSIDSHYDYKNIAQVYNADNPGDDSDSEPGNCNYQSMEDGVGTEDDCGYVRVPVEETVNPAEPAQCDALYAMVTTKTSSVGTYLGGKIQRLDETSNTLTGNSLALPTGRYSATLAISPDGKKFFTAADDNNALLMYDTALGKWQTKGTFNMAASRLVRMGITPQGVGYAMDSSGNLWTFDMSGNVSYLGKLKTISSGAPSFYENGDFFATADGKLYMLSAQTGGKVSLWFIDPVAKTAEYLGNLTTTSGNIQYGGLAATPKGIFASNGSGELAKVDVMNVKLTSIGGSHKSSTDLASCHYPGFAPKLSATKRVANITRPGEKAARPGDVLEYSIVVRNSGTMPAGSVTFKDLLPAGTSYVADSAKVNGFTSTVLNGQNVSLSGSSYPFGNLVGICSKSGSACTDQVLKVDSTPGQIDNEAVITFRVKVDNPFTNSPSQVANQGFIKYNDGKPNPDPIPTDDPDTPEPNDPTITPVVVPQLAISKTSNGPWTVGQNGAQYTLTVKNVSKIDTISAIQVKDLLPAGLTVAGTPSLPSGWSLSGTQGLLSFTGTQTLAAGASVSLVIPVNVGNVSGSVTNKASVGGGGDPDPIPNPADCTPGPSNPQNQCAEHTTTIGTPTKLVVVKTVQNISANGPVTDSSTGKPGDLLEYCIKTTNVGSVGAKSITFNDPIPANTSFALNGYGAGQDIQWTGTNGTQYYTAAQDADAGVVANGRVTVQPGSFVLGAQQSFKVCFRVNIR